MRSAEIQEKIDEYEYWDAWVSRLECRYFADEIELAHEYDDNDEIVYEFSGCYKSEFDHVKNYDKLKPVKDMTPPQMPYYLQNVEIGMQVDGDITFYTCKINMFPLYLEIWCKDISVTKQNIIKKTIGK